MKTSENSKSPITELEKALMGVKKATEIEARAIQYHIKNQKIEPREDAIIAAFIAGYLFCLREKDNV